MAEETKEVKEGKLTSEFEVAKSSGVWGIVALVLGFITVNLAPLLDQFISGGSTAGVIAGAVIGVAGITQKLLVDLGYIKGRADVKVAASLKKVEGKVE